jgi:hypothetical protein
MGTAGWGIFSPKQVACKDVLLGVGLEKGCLATGAWMDLAVNVKMSVTINASVGT